MPAACVILISAGAKPPSTSTVSPGIQPTKPRRATSQPREFQEGVRIDWTRRAVYADARVVLREGPIEYLACFPGKEHESVLLFKASATHLYQALGLVGLTPGHPPRWNDARGRFDPPTGDLVDVTIEWKAGERDNAATGFSWLREIEYARAPIDRPWVFSGSVQLADGTLSADHAGDGVAVVDKPDALLSLSTSHVSRDADLWAQANTTRIPPVHTDVRVVFRPEVFRERRMRLDQRGALFVDGRYATFADAADLIALGRRLSPNRVQEIRSSCALGADMKRLRGVFAESGVHGESFHISVSKRHAGASTTP